MDQPECAFLVVRSDRLERVLIQAAKDDETKRKIQLQHSFQSSTSQQQQREEHELTHCPYRS